MPLSRPLKQAVAWPLVALMFSQSTAGRRAIIQPCPHKARGVASECGRGQWGPPESAAQSPGAVEILVHYRRGAASATLRYNNLPGPCAGGAITWPLMQAHQSSRYPRTLTSGKRASGCARR